MASLYRFFLHGILLYILWEIFFYFFRFNFLFTNIYDLGLIYFRDALLYGTHYFLNIVGYESYVDTIRETLHISGAKAVWVGRGCMGRNLQGLFAGFIIAYPGQLKSKFWYIPLGFGVIFMINIVRIGGLAIILKCCPDNMDFNHHFVFKYTVYFFIFLMWVFWIKKFATK